jgi:WD40 repeat protein
MELMVVLSAVGALLLALALYMYSRKPSSSPSPSPSPPSSTETEQAVPVDVRDGGQSRKGFSKKDAKAVERILKHKAAKLDLTDNKLFVTSINNHSDEVLDVRFTPTGKHVASCSSDHSIVLSPLSAATARNDPSEAKQSVSTRIRIDFDHATMIGFTTDAKYKHISCLMPLLLFSVHFFKRHCSDAGMYPQRYTQ